MAYSQDLRERVIAAVRAKRQSLDQIAQTYGVSAPTVDNWLGAGGKRAVWRLCRGLGALTPFIIITWRARRTTASIGSQTAAPQAPRVLKPRTPDDCPLCRRTHATPLLGNVRKPGVKPWPTRESRRGPAKRVCAAGHACPNAACVYHGMRSRPFTLWSAMVAGTVSGN